MENGLGNLKGRCKRRRHSEERHDRYCSPNIIRMIKSRRIRWAGHVARMEIGEVYTWFWWEDIKERNHLEDLGLDVKLILKWVFKK
jgi:hypothetical protein